MRRVCGRAADLGVAVGAQVAYRDLAGFGRRHIDYDPDELRDEIIYQIAALDGFCRLHGTRVRYVKPHGALYHRAGADPGQAAAVVAAILDFDPALPVLCQPRSALARHADERGVRVVCEGFADRAYRPDGGLVPRRDPNAVLTDVVAIAERAVRWALTGHVDAIDGSVLTEPVESLCVHSDTPGAALIAARVRADLIAAGVSVGAFRP